MAEATRDQIFEEIGSLKTGLSETNISLARIDERTERALDGVEQNREHFDSQLGQVWGSMNDTNAELKRVQGKLDGLGKGLIVIGFLITAGITIVGIIVK